jgi:hypothetical protein
MKLPLAKLVLRSLAAVLLSTTFAAGAEAKGRLLVVEHPTKLGWLSTDGSLRALPLPFAPSFTARMRLNDAQHVVIVDRASAPGKRRLAIVPLDGGKPSVVPLPKKRVRRNQLIQLVRYLPADKSLLFTALDMYRSAYFELRQGKRKAVSSLARFRRKLFARHVLPSGKLIVLHVPGFNKRSERSSSRHYTRKNPKARKQDIYFATSPRAKPRKLLGGRYVEEFWLRAGGDELLVLSAGKVDDGAKRKSYQLERLDIKGGGKAQRVATLQLPLRNRRGRFNSVAPQIYVFDTIPWALITSAGPRAANRKGCRSSEFIS